MLHVALAVTRCFDNSISHALLNHQGWFVSQRRFSEVESLAHKFSILGQGFDLAKIGGPKSCATA